MATTMNTSQNNAHPQYQSQNQYQYINPTPSQSIQNIKYFLESYKSSKVKEIFSEKFTNSGLYCEDSQIPDSFYRLRKPFDRNYAFFIPHANNKRNGNYYKNKNWYPKNPIILSKNCELIKKNKNENGNNEINVQEEGAKDSVNQNHGNRFYNIKYYIDDINSVENGPFSAGIVFTFLQNYYFNKSKEEQKKMNLLIRDVLDDSCFPPDHLYNSLMKIFSHN